MLQSSYIKNSTDSNGMFSISSEVLLHFLHNLPAWIQTYCPSHDFLHNTPHYHFCNIHRCHIPQKQWLFWQWFFICDPFWIPFYLLLRLVRFQRSRCSKFTSISVCGCPGGFTNWRYHLPLNQPLIRYIQHDFLNAVIVSVVESFRKIFFLVRI